MSTHFTTRDYVCANSASHGRRSKEEKTQIAKRSLPVAQENAGGQRVRDDFKFAKLRLGEVRASVRESLSLPRYLDDANRARADHNWRAHDFLDGRSALLFVNWHAFKNGCVGNDGEIVDQIGALFAKSPRSKGMDAGKGDLADGSQTGGSEEAKGALVGCESEDGDFMRLDAKILADRFDSAVQADGFALLA